MNIKEKILLVGGSGFIGQKLVQKCIKKGFKITIISRSKKQFEHKSINQIICDISKKKEIIKKLKKKTDQINKKFILF